MRKLMSLLIFPAVCCFGWHDPHTAITRAAIASLTGAEQRWLGPEAGDIIEIYCWNPDRYFNIAAAERPAMRVYCERPDGSRIHNVTMERVEDVSTFQYLMDQMVGKIRSGERSRAAQFAGTMAHLVEDSMCPAHALDMKIMQDLLPPPENFRGSLHAKIEFSAPPPDLSSRAPQQVGTATSDAARALVAGVYDEVHENRTHLIEIVRAAYSDDQAALDRFRAVAARRAAEVLADAYHTAFRIAGEPGSPHSSLGSRQEPQIGTKIPPASMNLLVAVRSALGALAIDRQALRTPLGGVRAALAEDGSVLVSGDWPPFEGVQELRLRPGGQRIAERLETSIRNRPDFASLPVRPDQWIKTVDHRGDPLFGLMLNGSGDISIRNHENAVCTIAASPMGPAEAAVLTCPGAAPVVIRASGSHVPVNPRVPGF